MKAKDLPKLVNGKVWVPVESDYGKGYQELPPDDPNYGEIRIKIDSQRFVELLNWIYGGKK